MKIERRRTIVTLHSGHFEAELAALAAEVEKAQRDEDSGVTPKRAGTRSLAIAKAKEWDDKRDEAEAAGVDVTVWALSYTEFGPLQDEHHPREDEADDKLRAVNMKTFPKALLRCSLVTPGTAEGDTPEERLADLQAKGDVALTALGDLTQVQYVKLENAAWSVNVGDDALPKYSLVSLLRQQRDPDSRLPSDSE